MADRFLVRFALPAFDEEGKSLLDNACHLERKMLITFETFNRIKGEYAYLADDKKHQLSDYMDFYEVTVDEPKVPILRAMVEEFRKGYKVHKVPFDLVTIKTV